MADIGRLKDAQTILERLLELIEKKIVSLTAIERHQLIHQLQKATNQPIIAIHNRPQAILFADDFIAAVHSLPRLATSLPPIGPELFNLRGVHDPALHHEATPDALAYWHAEADRIVTLAETIIASLEGLEN